MPTAIKPISDAKWKQLANKLDCEVAVLQAVAQVESAGIGFLSDGRAKILFEGHIFHRETKGKFSAKHPAISYPKWNRKKYSGTGKGEWLRLDAARKLDFSAANKSASWGAFQILGRNAELCGYINVDAFVIEMQTMQGQLDAFSQFVNRPGMREALQNKDWPRFAKLYNGTSYAINQYDKKLANAYQHIIDGEKTANKKQISQTSSTNKKFDNVLGPGHIDIGELDAPIELRLSARPDPVDLRDFLYRPSIAIPPPPEYLPDPAKIRHQGDTNACTGFALASVIERLLEKANRSNDIPVSPYMLYAQARRYDEFRDDPTDDNGSSLRGALKAWSRHGACSEKLWKNLSEPNRKKSDKAVDDWWNEAQARPLGAYYRIDPKHIRDMHIALLESGAIYASCMVHSGWDALLNKNLTTHPRIAKNIPVIALADDASVDEGHAFCIVGYTRDGFIVHNSWGENFGHGGYAILSYSDWIQNAMDAWVVQLGVVTREREDMQKRDGLKLDAKGGVRLSADPHLVEREISPYVINFGNNGNLSDSGKFHTKRENIDELVQVLMPAARLQFGLGANDTMQIALYIHGGLVDEDSAENSARVWVPFLFGKKIFPIVIVWETGLLSTVFNTITDKFTKDDELPSGASANKTAFREKFIETTARILGARKIWDEMKENAKLIAQSQTRGLSYLWRTLKQNQTTLGKVEMQLFGHSAGTILATDLANRILLEGVSANEFAPPIAGINFIAAAVRSDHAWSSIDAWLNQGFDPLKLRFAHLTENAEREDTCLKVYRQSLLYLVSNACENKRNTPLLGMQIDADPRIKARALKSKVIFSPGFDLGNGIVTKATSHGGMDDDVAVMTSVAK